MNVKSALKGYVKEKRNIECETCEWAMRPLGPISVNGPTNVREKCLHKSHMRMKCFITSLMNLNMQKHVIDVSASTKENESDLWDPERPHLIRQVTVE